MLKAGFEVYLPTKIEERQWSDRKKKIEVPLLPSMLLIRLYENETNQVFNFPGVVRYLFEHGKRAFVREDDVIAMKTYLASKNTLEHKNINIGDTIKVPDIDKQARILYIQGKKCIAQLHKMSAKVSFQLK